MKWVHNHNTKQLYPQWELGEILTNKETGEKVTVFGRSATGQEKSIYDVYDLSNGATLNFLDLPKYYKAEFEETIEIGVRPCQQ